jgi:hypothetical protein
MLAFKLPVAKLLVLLLINPIILFNAQAQQNFKYEGAFEMNDIKGFAAFNYKLQKEDTIYDGSFLFQHNSSNDLITKSNPFIKVSGQFIDDTPNGEWKFLLGDFQANNNIVKEGYTFKLKLNGTEHSAKGKIKANKPQGDWQQIIKEIKNGEIEDTLFISHFDFDEGVPIKSFDLRSSKGTLVGRLLAEGVAHDRWELYTPTEIETEEVWTFSEGRLLSIDRRIEGNSYSISIFPTEQKSAKLINLDKTYLSIIDMLQQIEMDTTALPESKLHKLLFQNADLYEQTNELISSLSSAQIRPGIKVLVEQYDYKRSLTDLFKDYQERSSKIVTEYKRLSESSQLNILKLADEEVFANLNALSFYEERYHQPFRLLLSYHQNELLQFLPINKLYRALPSIVQFQDSEVISYQWNDTTKNIKLEPLSKVNFEDAQTGLDTLKLYAAHVLGQMEQLETSLFKRIKKEERLQLIKELEKNLMTAMSSLNESVDSSKQIAPQHEQDILLEVRAFARKEIGNYSSLPDGNEKIDLAKSLISCFESLDSLTKRIAILPNKEKEIVEHYTDDKWNPFTSTVMSELEKRRIVEAYQEILIPYIINYVRKHIKCTTVNELNELYDLLHQRMMALRNEDTNRLERNLKGVDDAEKIFEMFGVELSNKLLNP